MLRSDTAVAHAPAFWGRNDFFESYYAMMRTRRTSVLVVIAEYLGAKAKEDAPPVGRTRLLRELANQAVRDGHVPCLVPSGRAGDSPQTPLQLATVLRDVILEVRRAFDLPIDSSDQLNMIIGRGHEARKYAKQVVAGRVTGRTVFRAVKHDLLQLASDARRRHKRIRTAGGRVIVLMDDVERYGAQLVREFFEETDGPDGLGSRDDPVPVVLAVARGGLDTASTWEILNRMNALPWVTWRVLRPFEPNGEGLLASEQVLLHPFQPDLYPGVSDVPLVVNDRLPSELAVMAAAQLDRSLGGLPGRFVTPAFYHTAETLRAVGYLQVADDLAILRAEAGPSSADLATPPLVPDLPWPPTVAS
jgi:hypothetical protein